MKIRNLVILLAWLLCVGAVGAVLLQHNQISALRSPVQTSMAGNESTQAVGGVDETSPGLESGSASRELLQLRAEVTQLTARKRELASVGEESERLKAQLAAGSTNSGGLPAPGYIRRRQAQFLGYSTPENTVQSWLWAIENHDLEKMLQAFSPSEAKSIEGGLRSKADMDQFFKGVGALPGLAIQSRQILPDGSAELQVYIAPQLPPEKIQLQLVNGEWKMLRF